MLTALLLAACLAPAPAAPDWVEISQQHYRKPARAHPFVRDGPLRPAYYPSEEETRLAHYYPKNGRPANQEPERLTPIENETVRLVHLPKDTRIYSNHSISEHNWNQNKYRAPSAKIKPNITPEFSLEIYETVTEDQPELETSKLDDQEKVSATVERVPNKGSVKRVQLSNTPVKSPSVTNAVSPIRRNDNMKYVSTPVYDSFSDEFEIKSDIFKNSQEVVAMSPSNVVEHVFSSTKGTLLKNYNRIITTTGWPISGPTVPFHKHPQIHKPDAQMETNNNWKDRTKNSDIENISIVKENRVPDEKIETEDIQTKLENFNKNKVNIPNFVTKYDKNMKPEPIDFEEATIGDENNANRNRPSDVISQFTKDQNTRQNRQPNNGGQNKTNEEIKVKTMENVMKFMKIVADTISKNTRRGVNGKVKYLNELKDTLLSSIKERIDTTWPDDTSAATRRHSRAATPRGHVEFPSSESALMTISFLTFAVFLIKLVLQVIQTYKNKAMMMAPVMVATAGRTLKKLRNMH